MSSNTAEGFTAEVNFEVLFTDNVHSRLRRSWTTCTTAPGSCCTAATGNCNTYFNSVPATGFQHAGGGFNLFYWSTFGSSTQTALDRFSIGLSETLGYYTRTDLHCQIGPALPGARCDWGVVGLEGAASEVQFATALTTGTATMTQSNLTAYYALGSARFSRCAMRGLSLRALNGPAEFSALRANRSCVPIPGYGLLGYQTATYWGMGSAQDYFVDDGNWAVTSFVF
jgi:hypothetical protein